MIVLILLFVLLLLVYLYQRRRNVSSLDVPGPSPLMSLPYLGHAYLLGKHPLRSLHGYREKYGDIFRLDVGNLRTVFVCGWKLIEEAAKSESFAGRPYKDVPAIKVVKKIDSRGNLTGVSAGSGQVWREQRRFMLHNLNDLGMSSKDAMEQIILHEAEQLSHRMTDLEGQVIQIQRFFLTAINNVIWRIVMGKRSDQDNSHLLDLTSRVTDYFEARDPGSVTTMVQLYSETFLNALRLLGISNIVDNVSPLYNMLAKEVVSHVSNVDDDYFLRRCKDEIEKRKEDLSSSFHGNDGFLHVIGQLFDFFAAGTDTVSTLLEWAVLYMCQYPEIQDRIHSEIKDCFGIDGSISLKDTFRLPFLEAMIEEIYRHSPTLVLWLPHATVCNATVGKKSIPKDIQVIFLVESVHRDPKLFVNPDKFNPERFIDKETNTFRKSDRVIAFGLGKRKCVGEQLARSEFFLFLAILLQKFRFSKAKEDQVLDFSPISGVIFYPKPFDMVIEKRK